MTQDIIYDPQKASRLAIQQIESWKVNPPQSTMTYIEPLDAMIEPLINNLHTLMAFTDNGKTTLLDAIAENNAEHCAPNEIVVKIGMEESIEEQMRRKIGRLSGIPIPALLESKKDDIEWKKAVDAATEAASTPLWLIGQSEQEYRKSGGAITVEDMRTALSHIMESQGKKIKLVVIDYFQRIGRPGGRDTRVQYKDMADELARLAMGVAPFLVASQVGREVERRDWKIPGISDMQETSALEHYSRTVFVQYLPIRHNNAGDPFEIGKTTFRVRPNTAIIGVLKLKTDDMEKYPPKYRAFELNRVKGRAVYERQFPGV